MDSFHCPFWQMFTSQLFALWPVLGETKYFVILGLNWSGNDDLASICHYEQNSSSHLEYWWPGWYGIIGAHHKSGKRFVIRPIQSKRSKNSTARRNRMSGLSWDLFTPRNSFAMGFTETLLPLPSKSESLRTSHYRAVSMESYKDTSIHPKIYRCFTQPGVIKEGGCTHYDINSDMTISENIFLTDPNWYRRGYQCNTAAES